MFLESVARIVLLGLNLRLHPAKWWTYYYWTLFPQLMLRSCSWPCRFRSIGGRNKTIGPASLRRIVGSSAYYRCCVGKGSSAKTLLSAFQTSPVATLKSFKLPTFQQPLYRLETCFSRLKPNQQADLVWLAVFPRKFIGVDAKLSFSHRFDYDLKMFLRGLVDTSCSYPLSE